MAKGLGWTMKDMKDKGLVQNANGDFVPVKSLVAKKVDKISTGIPMFNATPENKKVRNATKATNEQGVKFDSLLEKYLYDLLTSAKIHFEFQKQYLLQEKFKYRDEAVRAITLTADFYLPTHGIIADSKGFQTQQGAMRWKMLKSVLKHIYDDQPEIIILKNKKECDAFVNKLLYGTA